MARKKSAFRIVLGSDHGGFPTKNALVKLLKKDGYSIKDIGTFSDDATDYPDYAFRVGKAVSAGRFDRGILVCGTGIGMSIAANKVKGVRAAVCWSPDSAKLASMHNWANILCLSGRFMSISGAKKIVKTWLKTPRDESPRHARRLKKISKFESNL